MKKAGYAAIDRFLDERTEREKEREKTKNGWRLMMKDKLPKEGEKEREG